MSREFLCRVIKISKTGIVVVVVQSCGYTKTLWIVYAKGVILT